MEHLKLLSYSLKFLAGFSFKELLQKIFCYPNSAVMELARELYYL